VLAELKKDIEVGEVLKAGIGLNNEGMLYPCENTLLGLDVSLQVVLYQSLLVDLFKSVQVAGPLSSYQKHLSKRPLAQFSQNIEVIHTVLSFQISHEDGLLHQSHVLRCDPLAFQYALISQISPYSLFALAALCQIFLIALNAFINRLLTNDGFHIITHFFFHRRSFSER
jgi:hypothetical protein